MKLTKEDKTKIEELKNNNKEVINSLTRLDYFIWSYSFDELTHMLVLMYDNLGLIEEFNIPVDALISFSKNLQSCYFDNPYHNFLHAFDVTQMCFYFIKKSKCKDYLTKIDQLALLTSALCHDVSHPGYIILIYVSYNSIGTTNTYQINAQSELSLL